MAPVRLGYLGPEGTFSHPALLDDAFWSRSEAQAVAAVPVRWQGRMIATLLVGFADPERLTPSEIELLDEIGRQVALGMERLRLQRQPDRP